MAQLVAQYNYNSIFADISKMPDATVYDASTIGPTVPAQDLFYTPSVADLSQTYSDPIEKLYQDLFGGMGGNSSGMFSTILQIIPLIILLLVVSMIASVLKEVM